MKRHVVESFIFDDVFYGGPIFFYAGGGELVQDGMQFSRFQCAAFQKDFCQSQDFFVIQMFIGRANQSVSFLGRAVLDGSTVPLEWFLCQIGTEFIDVSLDSLDRDTINFRQFFFEITSPWLSRSYISSSLAPLFSVSIISIPFSTSVMKRRVLYILLSSLQKEKSLHDEVLKSKRNVRPPRICCVCMITSQRCPMISCHFIMSVPPVSHTLLL